jgi:hypothetical protein
MSMREEVINKLIAKIDDSLKIQKLMMSPEEFKELRAEWIRDINAQDDQTLLRLYQTTNGDNNEKS